MTQRICDCVLSQNGLGMSGRECNCGNDENAALDRAAADEIERLRAVLQKIAAMDEICVTDFDGVNGWAHQWIARAALAKGENDDTD
jgi:hypothetical protein